MGSEATLDYIIVYEQNWLGGGWTDEIEQPGWGWEKLQDDNMLTISYVVYPPELQKRNSTTISSISTQAPKKKQQFHNLKR